MARFVRLREEAIVGLLLRGGRRLRLFCHEMRDERAAEQARLLAFANGGAVGPGVVAACFDGIEHGDAPPAENFQVDPAAGGAPFLLPPASPPAPPPPTPPLPSLTYLSH